MAEEVRGPLQLLVKPLWSTIIRPFSAHSNTFRESNPAKSDDLLHLLKPSIVLQVTLVMDGGVAQLKEKNKQALWCFQTCWKAVTVPCFYANPKGPFISIKLQI